MPIITEIAEAFAAGRNAGEQPVLDGLPLFRIPVENLSDLETKIEKINRKADKLGTEPVILTTVGHYEREIRSEITGEVESIQRYAYVTINGTTPKLNGWALAAAIDHLGGSEGNLIRNVPGVELDTTPFREANADCDHCGWNRRRKSTYIVKHDDGTVKQVGTNCLGDFTGAHNPEKAARWAEYLMEIMDAAGASESGGSGSRVHTLSEWLANVAVSIRQTGWVSGGRAWNTGEVSTKDDAANRMFNAKTPKEARPDDEDREEAAATIQWVRENIVTIPVEERDDFQHNMAVIFSRDYLEGKGMGISAYAPVARARAIEKEIKEKARKQRKAKNDFIGEEGERNTWTLTVTRIISLTNYYSNGSGDDTKPLYIMMDEDGNETKWFASNWNANLAQGSTYKIKGTIKKNEDDEKYGKCSILTRCKVQEEVAA